MAEQTKKLSKSTLFKACTIWVEFANAGYSWIRLMGNTYAQMMVPIAHELYPDDKQARNAMIARSMDFYNTEPAFGNVINGIAVSMEERIANGDETITGDDITMIRTSLMGPLAGIGDTIHNMINIILVAIFTDLTMNGAYLIGPLLFILCRWGEFILISHLAFNYGYAKGGDAIEKIISSGQFENLITMANIVGCVVMGAMMCQYVKVTCGLKIATENGVGFDFQTGLFDALLPNMLPLCFTLLCWWLITRKRVSITKLMLIIIAVAAVGGMLGILV